ncbi:MAG: excinuclease ABC subunit UvrB [Candidatus Dojkabacteria bacterium]|nr:excinuclease ABC subunit UvrB [Candidatus Dojkabacteria bacterium]
MSLFSLKAPYKPSPAQETAIAELTQTIEKGSNDTTLLGVTGSGKTFVMANVIALTERPTLILSHNKTLAAQLYEEYSDFFPDNAVKYFVSYYDYYQPEAYVPSKDLYIEKESDVNREIERYRLSAMNSVLRRRDVIVVASVSCIYNIGKPDDYQNLSEVLNLNQQINLPEVLRQLAVLQYERGDYEFMPGSFRLRGDILEIFPPYDDYAVRVELFGETVERISRFDPLTGTTIDQSDGVEIFPAKNFAVSPEVIAPVAAEIRKDLAERLAELKKQNKLLEAQRLEQRTQYDLEMLEQTGFCAGIENYSRYFDGRKPGEPSYTLLDYFPDDFLMIIDESHMTIPQVGGMYEGDRSRKQTLVDFGFRLPSALDNRPLNFKEFESKLNQTVYTSATPAQWELDRSAKEIVELVVRPTGLLDPTVEVRKTEHQIDDVISEVQANTGRKQRTLITTLTKRMAEDLTSYLKDMGIKVQYLHSDIDTVERIDILRDLRLGVYDVVVGINLLREGIDLPEVSLVIILDADKEGFLRAERSLIQTMGRAARHADSRVIMYGDKMTDSMKKAISETGRRRSIQQAYNKKHGITPKTIEKKIRKAWKAESDKDAMSRAEIRKLSTDDIKRNIKLLEGKMYLAAQNLDYEQAAELRDQIKLLKQHLPS